MSRQLAVESSVTEVPRRVVQPSTFPEGSWEQLDEVDLTDFFLLRLPMLKSCPHFLRSRLRESFGAAFAERHRAKSVGDELGESRAWKLFHLVPAMLLHRPRCAGSIGRDELARRADQFAAGRWTELINQARQTATRISRVTPDLDEAEDQRRRGNAAQSRIQHGQVSRARHELTGARLAPRTEETLAELQRTRPQEQRRQISPDILEYRPEVPLSLDKELFINALRSSPSGSRRLHQ